MLEDLEILNGKLELKFDKYTYEYTVVVPSDVDSLEFNYKLQDDTYIDIRDNILDSDENIVYVDVYNIDDEDVYTFYVYKENDELSSGIDEYKKSLEVASVQKIDAYKVEILCCSLFLLVVIVFSLMFHKKRKY